MSETYVSQQAIQAAQGTRLSEKAPWETYSQELDLNMSPELAAAVDEYSTHYHDRTSNQTREELARWKEMSDYAAQQYQWCTPEEYKDFQMRMGRIMHSSEIISILRNKFKVNCWYREHPQKDKITLMVLKNDKLQVGCWVQSGWMPEYTVMGFDDHGAPLAEKYRGWRTILLQLILKKVITEEKAHRIFGPAEKECSERYNMILWGARNTIEEE